MLDNFKVDFLKKGSVKTFNSSDKVSRIPNCNMDIWWFHGGIFFLMSDFVGDCEEEDGETSLGLEEPVSVKHLGSGPRVNQGQLW